MKLLKLRPEGNYKGLKDQSFNFLHSSDNIITFIGLNGSGKSQLLELIAEVFGYLERACRSDFKLRKKLPFIVKLEYQISAYLDTGNLENFKINIIKNGVVECFMLYGDDWHSILLSKLNLPQHVVGYASGLNENLQRSFLKNSVQYFDVMSVRSTRRKKLAKVLDEKQREEINKYYLNRYPGIFRDEFDDGCDNSGFGQISEKDTKIPMSIFLDYDCSALLMASLAILSNERLDEIFPDIPYRYPQSICIQYDLRGIPFEEDAIRDITQLITDIGLSSVTGISNKTSDEEYDLYGLDYLAATIKIDLTRDGLRELMMERYYGLPIRLFEKLYKIQLLGVKYWRGTDKTLLRNDAFFGTVKKTIKGKLPLAVIDLKLSNGVDTIDFNDMSDGEAQLVQVLSAAQIFSPDNTLFIFDEPDTHLNPSWRTHFHKHLSSAIENNESDTRRLQILLSTHSPFLLSSLKKENVFRFQRNENGIAMSPVESETYGASFDSLIKEYYGLKSLISQTAVDDIKRHLHDLGLSKEEQIEWLEKNIGDSMEKAYLLRRLQE